MRRLHIGRRTLLVAALVALTLAFIGVTLASSRWLRAARIDLTADHLYTLTPGTQHIIDGLHRPLKLTLYFSEHATRDLPQPFENSKARLRIWNMRHTILVAIRRQPSGMRGRR